MVNALLWAWVLACGCVTASMSRAINRKQIRDAYFFTGELPFGGERPRCYGILAVCG